MGAQARLKDKVVLVTGCALGIGRAVARRAAHEGASVCLNDLPQQSLASLSTDIRTAGARSLEVPADVTSRAEARRMVDAVVAEFGRLDVLINNAGGITHYPRRAAEGRIPGPPDSTESVSEEYWDYMFELNCKAAFLCSQAVIPVFKRQKSGSIVNIASQSARRTMLRPGIAYNCAKSAMLGLTRHLAVELAASGIRCNTAASGLTRTERVEKLHLSDVSIAGQLVSQIPMGRAATVEEQARAILFLASDDAAYITGTTLDIDGGFCVG